MNMQLSIKDLRVNTIIGIYPEERTKAQEILFNIDIIFDAKNPANSDNISQTIDYYKLSESIADFVQATSYNLLEKLIYDISTFIMQDKQIISCHIEACKTQIKTRAKSISLSFTNCR